MQTLGQSTKEGESRKERYRVGQYTVARDSRILGLEGILENNLIDEETFLFFEFK